MSSAGLPQRLDLNLIIYLLYLSALQFGVQEADLIRACQQNSFGYFTQFKNFLFLKKAWTILRPVNAPFKNKWLRDVNSTHRLN
jgi:hypothetical protein